MTNKIITPKPTLEVLVNRFFEIATKSVKMNLPTKAYINHSMQGFNLSMDDEMIIHIEIEDEEIATISMTNIVKHNLKINILESFTSILPLKDGYTYNFSL